LFQNLNYINGIQQGLQIEYYNDGKKLSEYTCDNGLIDGLKVTYYSTGHYAYSEIYEKGINKGYL
jgi:antitoxin component YwqK of YwqJK toxin-antitoxin module